MINNIKDSNIRDGNIKFGLFYIKSQIEIIDNYSLFINNKFRGKINDNILIPEKNKIKFILVPKTKSKSKLKFLIDNCLIKNIPTTLIIKFNEKKQYEDFLELIQSRCLMCPICLMPIFILSTTCKDCNNQFHFKCVNKWFDFDKKKTCPMCRAETET